MLFKVAGRLGVSNGGRARASWLFQPEESGVRNVVAVSSDGQLAFVKMLGFAAGYPGRV